MPEIIPFMGRVKELEKLEEAIDARGEPRLICIHGPGGMMNLKRAKSCQAAC